MLRRLATITFAVASLAGLSACGGEHEVKVGHTEGVYVTTGDLRYQVQISRILNEADEEDRAYIGGLTDELDRELPAGLEWFGVFLRVQNTTDEPHRTSGDIKITDTTGAEFHPVPIDPRVNALAYEPGVVIPPGNAPTNIYPFASSIANESATQGALLLFKIPRQNLENRPLELEIDGEGGPAHVELDV